PRRRPRPPVRRRRREGPGSDARPPVIIRPEEQRDFDAIRAVVAGAFGSDVEAKLVDDIRADACYRPDLALVADDGGAIVGHVMISHAELRDGDAVRRVAMLSPLAVAPDRQK